jgi:Tfp pilus assembly protein PilF
MTIPGSHAFPIRYFMVNKQLVKKFRTTAGVSVILFLLITGQCFPAFGQVKSNKKPQTDTFKIVNNLIAKKKFRKADNTLKKYRSAHPKDINAIWLQAQTKLYLNNNNQSDYLYQSAIKLQPDNDYLKLDYIHSSADMGRTEQAENLLSILENTGKDYSEMALLHARIHYYNGDYKQAAAYMKKAQLADNKNAAANALNDEIELAKATKVSLNSSYLTDNQPLTALISTVKAEKYFGKALNLYVEADDYHFLQDKTTDAPWIKAGDRIFFPKAGLRVNVNGGVIRYPVKNITGLTGELSLNEKLSQQFDVDLGVDHVPYFGTRASVDTNISVTRFSGMLNWHLRNWVAQAAYLNSQYPGDNNVYAVYGWVLAPVATFPAGKFQLGYSISYNNSTINNFRPSTSLGEAISGKNISGVYDPYFTPKNLVTNSALLALSVNLSPKVSLNINGDVGYASVSNPYFFLNKNKSGATVIDSGFATEYFVPYSATLALNYQIDKTWSVAARYIYRSTYFFNSNYVGLGIQKSFLHRQKNQPEKAPKSAFMKSVKEVEQKIQSLYSCKNKEDLRQSVSKIKSQLTALRDAQLKKKNTTEVTPGSEEALKLQDRYNSLNDMIEEIDEIGLDDKDVSVNKREWLIDKQYELTSISYNGSYDEE